MEPSAPSPMHTGNLETVELRERIFDYARYRMDLNPAPLDLPMSLDDLNAAVGQTITETGLGGLAALSTFTEILAPACLSVDHPNYLSFIPCAPTEAASLFDLVVSASSIYGGSWMEGSGAVFAENQVLSWLAAEVGLPETAGGVFVQGGTLGNLSALVAARFRAQQRCAETGTVEPRRWKLVCSAEAHSSLKTAAHVMGIDLVTVPVDPDGRMRGQQTEAALAGIDVSDVFAIVATAGTTNFGIVDRLDEVGALAARLGIWFHVDGAYGLAGILAPSTRALYRGVELADSFIVDPHKWLYAPFDACALVYRDPSIARAAHTQHGEYLDPLTDTAQWNPSDYAVNLTRRPRGLPLWFSLASHGVAAYRKSIEQNLSVTRQIATEIRNRPNFELVREPELSVVAFRKAGWTAENYERWSNRMLVIGKAFAVPSSHAGEAMMRFAIINPLTSVAELVDLLDEMDQE